MFTCKLALRQGCDHDGRRLVPPRAPMPALVEQAAPYIKTKKLAQLRQSDVTNAKNKHRMKRRSPSENNAKHENVADRINRAPQWGAVAGLRACAFG